MPLISYFCTCGKTHKKYVKEAKDASTSIKCECGAVAKRGFGATSSSHKVSIDNGVMARRVEVSPDIMQINDDRSDRDYSEED